MWKSFNKKYILFLMHWMCRMHTLWSNLYNISLSHSLAAFTRWNSVHFFRYNFHHVELFFLFSSRRRYMRVKYSHEKYIEGKNTAFFCMIPRCRCAIQFISLSLARFFFNRRMRFYNFRFEEYLNSEDGNNRENRTHWFAFNCNLMCFSLLYCK